MKILLLHRMGCLPMAAAVGVLVRFALAQYLRSKLYLGPAHEDEAELPPKPPRRRAR